MDDTASLAAQTLAQDAHVVRSPSPEHAVAPPDTAEPVFYPEFDGVDPHHHRHGDSDDDEDEEGENEKEDGEGGSVSGSSSRGRHHHHHRRGGNSGSGGGGGRSGHGGHGGRARYERMRRPLPPLPDLRFEQSYLASIAPAQGVWWKVGLITAKDQVVLPLLQGLGFNLVLFGWRWWNRSVKFRGAGLGGTPPPPLPLTPL